MNSIIKTEKLVKIFQTEEVETIALNGVDIEGKEREFVALMGPSGCGKSTLLNILGMLDILRLYKNIVHMHKSIIVQLILFSVSFSLFAQNEMPERTILRNIKVIDEVGDTLLKNAQLNVYDTNGKSISAIAFDRLIIVNDREKYKGYVLDIEGRHDTIVIEAKVEGYTCVDTTLILSKRKIINAVGNRYIWQDEIQLKTTSELSRELQELMVNATRILMVHAGDTVVYNAATLQLSAGSMLDDLVSFLPGAQLDSGGKFTINGEKVLDDISFIVGHDDKIAFVGGNEIAKTTLFQILAGEMEPDEGTYKWGVTTSQAYFPKDNTAEFDNDLTITDWLTGYSPVKDATYVRGFLGRMLFPGEDGVKKVRILSGGEKVRCLLSKMMISGANCLIFDEPTNHLDMESITALNNGVMKFKGVVLFSCHDHQFVQTTANRIMEILPNGKMIDKITTYDEYLASDDMARKRTVYTARKEEDEN